VQETVKKEFNRKVRKIQFHTVYNIRLSPEDFEQKMKAGSATQWSDRITRSTG